MPTAVVRLRVLLPLLVAWLLPPTTIFAQAPAQPTPASQDDHSLSIREYILKYGERLSPEERQELEGLLDLIGATASAYVNIAGDDVPFPVAINDPLEPVNRGFWVFNDQLIDWFFNPVTKFWRFIFPRPARKSIDKAAYNLAYPVRLFNTMLQGKWKGAGIETGRFLLNTTVGLLGFFDPATRLGMPTYDEDFGQTFGVWGMGPGWYLNLPFFGPGSGREVLAMPFNMVTNLGTLIPGAGLVFRINEMSFRVPQYYRLVEVEHDPYVLLRDVWALTREKDVVDLQIRQEELDSLPTLQAIFLRVHDPEFPNTLEERSVRIPATENKLPYSYRLQPQPAPLVYVLGGVGTHRLSEPVLAFAELLYANGFSVVTISSVMNWEFIERGATHPVPGNVPVDARDVHTALDLIHRQLTERYPERITAKALLGTSLGALHTLFIASLGAQSPVPLLQFDRYIAINPPVDMIYALGQLDALYNAPKQWTAEERDARIERTLLKAAKLAEGLNGDLPGRLPFDETESKYLIGLSFRLILRDIIYSSQRRHDLHVLSRGLGRATRNDIYREISEYSYIEYLREFVLPYFRRQSAFRQPIEELLRKSNLWSLDEELRDARGVRVFINQDDFLLRPSDINWLRGALGPERLTIFEEGGHLGNLYLPRVQDEIMGALLDLKHTQR